MVALIASKDIESYNGVICVKEGEKASSDSEWIVITDIGFEQSDG